MSLIAADERDILRVRTNARGEDMHLYRVMMPKAAMRSLFLAYLDEAQALKNQPQFYNTLTANCTTIVFEMVRRIVPGLPLDYRLMASGYLDRYLFDVQGWCRPDLPAAARGGHVTARARAANATRIFSHAIRRGMPGYDEAGFRSCKCPANSCLPYTVAISDRPPFAAGLTLRIKKARYAIFLTGSDSRLGPRR